MEGIEGKSYGPYPLRVCAEKVADFVTATSDDADRWIEFAPPGWAAAALFVVAPVLLTDPDLGDAGTSVIHGEQRFEWARPLPIEADLTVTGFVPKVRERGGVFFTTFEFEANDQAGPVVQGTSIFLMSGSSPPGSAGDAVNSPSPGARGTNDDLPGRRSKSGGGSGALPPTNSGGGPRALPPTKSGGGRDALPPTSSGGGPGALPMFPSMRRSAARSDLVRYAGATRDWNPIHWDHDSAVAAGLPTTVVHGLLQAAWLLSAASVLSEQAAPIADARFRFRSPMVAGAEGFITGDVNGSEVSARLAVGDREIVSATMTLR
jgi:acyl dehydratase